MSNVGAQEPHRGGRRRRRRVVRPPRVARAGDAAAREVLAGVLGLQREVGGAQNHHEEDLSCGCSERQSRPLLHWGSSARER